jgi:hypothetical protein
MGWCREDSDFTTQRIRLFPAREVMYRVHRGMESQMCTVSRPGRPVRKKEVLVWLKCDMMIQRQNSRRKCNLRP